MDFGIARALTETTSGLTGTSMVIGTAGYLSPEQAQGRQVDLRSDLYSTGCLLYELLLGRPPFVGDSSISVAYQHVREVATRPASWFPGSVQSSTRWWPRRWPRTRTRVTSPRRRWPPMSTASRTVSPSRRCRRRWRRRCCRSPSSGGRRPGASRSTAAVSRAGGRPGRDATRPPGTPRRSGARTALSRSWSRSSSPVWRSASTGCSVRRERRRPCRRSSAANGPRPSSCWSMRACSPLSVTSADRTTKPATRWWRSTRTRTPRSTKAAP